MPDVFLSKLIKASVAARCDLMVDCRRLRKALTSRLSAAWARGLPSMRESSWSLEKASRDSESVGLVVACCMLDEGRFVWWPEKKLSRFGNLDFKLTEVEV